MGFKGIGLILINSVFVSFSQIIVKFVSDVPSSQKVFIRFMGTLLLTFPLLIIEQQHPFVSPTQTTLISTLPSGEKYHQLSSNKNSLLRIRLLIFARSIINVFGLYLNYCSLQYLSLGNATILSLTSPIFVCILARIFLKEPFGIFHAVMLIISLVGIAMVSKMKFIFGGELLWTNELIGISLNLSASILGSITVLIIRKVNYIPLSVMVFNLSWIGVIIFAIITHFLTPNGFQFAHGGIQPYLLFILGIFGFFSQFFFTKAIQCEEAAIIIIIKTTSQVLFSFILQILIFDVYPDVYSIIGAFLITLSVISFSLRNQLTALWNDKTKIVERSLKNSNIRNVKKYSLNDFKSE